MFIDVKEFPGLNLILPPLGGIAIHRVCWLVGLFVGMFVSVYCTVCLFVNMCWAKYIKNGWR